MTKLLTVLLSLAFCSCAHLSAPEKVTCKAVDWWEMGRTEGVVGTPLKDAIVEAHNRCPNIDFEAFQNGFEAGLIDYCTPAQGLAMGRNDQPYQKVCPSYLEPAFLKSYAQGQKLHAMELERSEASLPRENFFN